MKQKYTKHKVGALLITALLFAGCGSLRYKQESGFHAVAGKGVTNMVANLDVSYGTNGELTSVTYHVTNAASVDVADFSRALALSVIAKSKADAIIGNRKGTYNNNSDVRADGVETEEKLSTNIKAAGALKSPVAVEKKD